MAVVAGVVAAVAGVVAAVADEERRLLGLDKTTVVEVSKD